MGRTRHDSVAKDQAQEEAEECSSHREEHQMDDAEERTLRQGVWSEQSLVMELALVRPALLVSAA